MTCAIFERAAVRVQPSATRGNFETQKPKKGPKFFEAKIRRVLRPTGAAPEFLPLNINKKATLHRVASGRDERASKRPRRRHQYPGSLWRGIRVPFQPAQVA